MPRRLRIAALSLGGFLLVLACAAAGAMFWLNSAPGRDFVLRAAVDAAADGGTEIILDGVDGRLLGEIRIRSATLLDADGPWMHLDGVSFRWTPSALLRGHLRLDAIEAAGIDFLRPPVLPDEAGDGVGGGVPSLPLRITLERLSVERLVLREPVIGGGAELALRARAAALRNAARLTLDIRRLDRPGAASARLGYDLAADALDLHLEAEEPRGGVAATLAGLPGQPALRAVLAGEGPLSAWAGRLRVTADGEDWIALDGTVDGTAHREIAVTGGVGLAPLVSDDLVPDELARALGGSVAVSAHAAVANGEVSLEHAMLTTEGATLALSGAFRVAGQRWSGRADIFDIAPALQAYFGVSLDGPFLGIEARGERGGATAELRLDARRVSAAGVAVEDVEATVEAVSPRGSVPVALAARLDARLTTLPGGESVAPLLGPLSLRARARTDGAAVDLREGSLAAGPLALTVAGRYADGGAEAAVSADIRDLTAFTGEARPDAAVPAQMAARLRYRQADGLAVDGMTLTVPQGRLTGQARLDAAFERLRASVDIPGLDLAGFSALAGTPLAGTLSGQLTASGSLADPEATAALRLADGSVDGTPLPALILDARGTGFADVPHGDVALRARAPQGEAGLRGRFSLSPDALDLREIVLSGPGIDGRGNAAVALDSGLASGTLRIEAPDIAPVLRIAGLDGGGSGAIEVTLAATDGVQSATLAGEVSGLAVTRDGEALLRLGYGVVDARGALGGDSPVTAWLRAVDLAGGGVVMDEVRLDTEGTPDRLSFHLRVSAPAYRALEIGLRGSLEDLGDSRLLRLSAGEGKVMGKAFSLAPGMEAVIGSDEYRLRDLMIAGPELGRLAVAGAMRGGQVEAEAEARDVPLDLFAPEQTGEPWSGGLALDARVSGTVARPMATLRIEASEVRPPDGGDLPAGNAVLEAALDDVAGFAVLNVTGVAEQPLVFRARVGRGPQGLGFDNSSPLAGEASWTGRLEALTALFPLVGQRAEGNLAIEASVDGTLGAPSAKGSILATDAEVEVYATGTVLRLPRVEIVGNDRRIEVLPFEASVAGEGFIAGQARVELDADAGFPLSAGLELRRARLVDRDDITAVLSGRLSAEGPVGAPDVMARLTSDRIEIRADVVAPPSVPAIEVTEVGPAPEHGLPRRAPAAPDTGPPAGSEIGLDVALKMPGQVFVRGRGLDSEWEGQIAVTGTAAAPRVAGRLTSRRGQFDLVGKIFELRPSQIDLVPDATGGVDVILSITAVHRGPDIGVTVTVGGTATRPDITLTSTPALPQEEILSRLLFGKARAQLSAVEAVQLAQALSSLTGGGGFDALGAIRQALGVDVLRVDTSDPDGAPAVEAGKYISRDVYVGVRQGTGAGAGSAVTVEIDIFRNVVVESEIRQDGSNRVGAKYRIDY